MAVRGRDRAADGWPQAAPAPARPRAGVGPGRRRGLGPPRRLLFVNQYYWPDHASTAQHLTDLAESLAGRGARVSTSSAPRGGTSRARPGRRRYEVHNGVHIHRVPATSLGRQEHPLPDDRLPELLRPGAGRRRCSLPRFDVVVTLTTPPIIGLIGTLLRRFKGSRHVYWSMDLHPDASLALGRMSRRNPVVAWLAWLSDFVYRQADKVVVLGPYMADRIAAKRVRPDRLATIPVWSRRDEIYPLPREGHPLREPSSGLADKFVAMYSGNLGLAHSLRRVPRGRPAAPRPRRHRLPVRRRRPPAGRGPRGAGGRGARQHPVPRLLPPRAAPRLALGGRRPPDLDAGRDDRDRRPGQALRGDGLGPADRSSSAPTTASRPTRSARPAAA